MTRGCLPRWFRILLGIVVLAIAAMLVMNAQQKFISTDDGSKARWDVRSILLALREYAVENRGSHPESLDELVRPDSKGVRCLRARRVPRDPWKQPYRYEPPRAGETTPHVWSVGADGESGTSDDVDSRGIELD